MSDRRSWHEYVEVQRLHAFAQHIREAQEDAVKLPELRRVVTEGSLLFPRHAPSIRMTMMYLAHVSLEWNMARIGRAFNVHRTVAGRYVRHVEEARDNQSFDETLNAIEATLNAPPGGNRGHH